MSENQKYAVHFKGQKVAGPYSTLKRASRVADKKDLEYGASAHEVRPYGAGHAMEKHGEGKPIGITT